MDKNVQHIITRCLNNDRKAQKELFQLHNGQLYASAYKYLNDKDKARDILQDSWLDIFNTLGKYDQNKSQFSTWINTILIRKIWKTNKDSRHLISLDIKQDDTSFVDRQDIAIDRLSCEEILNELDKIPAASRMVFKMYVLEGYRHKEIANILNINESTSRVHLAKARKILQDRLTSLNQITGNGRAV